MVVADVLSVLSAFDTALATITGVLISAFLVGAVIDWFRIVGRDDV